MPPALAGRLSRFLVGCYPRRWRERYAEEMLEVLGQHRPTARTVLNLWASALGSHLDPAYRMEGRSMIRRHKKWLVGAAAVSAVPMVLLLLVSIAAWQENLGNNGPPLPLSQGVFGVAFSPDGRTVAVINPSLEMWSVADPAHPRRLGYSKGDIVTGADPAFSPDGRVLATAGQQNVILWNVTDPVPRPTQIAVLSASPSFVNAVLFSPDGSILASGYADGTMVLWNTADPAHVTRIATLARQAGGVSALSFSPDGCLLASASADGTVVLRNTADPAHVTRIATLARQAGGVSALSFSPDGRLLASASADGTVVLRNTADPAAPVITATGRFPAWPPPQPGAGLLPGAALAFSASGHTLTAIAGSSTVTVWNVTGTGGLARVTTITTDSIGSGPVAFSSGGHAVAGAPATGDTLALWTLP
jgi:WD40 repeat protein